MLDLVALPSELNRKILSGLPQRSDLTLATYLDSTYMNPVFEVSSFSFSGQPYICEIERRKLNKYGDYMYYDDFEEVTDDYFVVIRDVQRNHISGMEMCLAFHWNGC